MDVVKSNRLQPSGTRQRETGITAMSLERPLWRQKRLFLDGATPTA
jgi:hypothetical protein